MSATTKASQTALPYLAGGLADQPIDAGAEHAAEAVKSELHRADGTVQLQAAPAL